MARRNIKVKPGKAQSTISFVVGIAFVFIGLFVVIPLAGPFGLLWTFMAGAMTVVNGMNAFGKKGVPTMEIYTEDEQSLSYAPSAQSHDHIPSVTLDAKERLEQLEELKKTGLVTQQEYDQKREEILRGL